MGSNGASSSRHRRLRSGSPRLAFRHPSRPSEDWAQRYVQEIDRVGGLEVVADLDAAVIGGTATGISSRAPVSWWPLPRSVTPGTEEVVAGRGA